MAKRTIPRTCENCQNPFLAEAHEINIGNARFCSRLCANKIIRRGSDYTEPTCRQCGSLITAPRPRRKDRMKYCGAECRMAALAIDRRFWAKVDKAPGHGPHGDCWLWTGGRSKHDYGQIKADRMRGAHVVSWQIHNGPIEGGLHVLHHCDNPPCVRPDHLFLGTQQDNMRDMDRKGRRSLNAHKKLSAEQVREIRILYAAGQASYAKLARKYGVSDSAVYHVVRRRTWSTTL